MAPHWYLDFHAVLKLVLAVVLGGAIGFERERHGRDAGFRTHIIVCLASTLVLVASRYFGDVYYGAAEALRVDPGRISAGIITGIGFLGAGTILRMHDAVRGLTTAACLWLVAGIGIVIGVGCYALAIAGTVVALFVLYVFGRLEKYIVPDAYVILSIEGKSAESILDAVQKIAADLGLKVKNYSVRENCADGTAVVSSVVKFKRRLIGTQVVAKAREIPGVKNITWERPAS